MPLLAIVFALLCSSCQAQVAPVFDTGTIQVGPRSLYVQLARTPDQLSYGLMHRTTLEPFHGMLFIFPSPGPVSFWMKNTLIPLDIGYFDSQGRLCEIYAMAPHDTTPIPSRSRDILYALELPQGDFDRLGLQINDILTLPEAQKGLDNTKSVLQ